MAYRVARIHSGAEIVSSGSLTSCESLASLIDQRRASPMQHSYKNENPVTRPRRQRRRIQHQHQRLDIPIHFQSIVNSPRFGFCRGFCVSWRAKSQSVHSGFVDPSSSREILPTLSAYPRFSQNGLGPWFSFKWRPSGP